MNEHVLPGPTALTHPINKMPPPPPLTESERKLVARELHDTLAHSLTLLRMFAELSRNKVAAEPSFQSSELAILNDLFNSARLDLENLSTLSGFKSPGSLKQSLQMLVETTFKSFSWALNVDSELETLHQHAVQELVGIAREALNNAVKHANPAFVVISARLIENQCHFMVTNDGGAFRPKQARKSLGILGMAERAKKIGGKFSISTNFRSETTVQVFFPFEVNKRSIHKQAELEKAQSWLKHFQDGMVHSIDELGVQIGRALQAKNSIEAADRLLILEEKTVRLLNYVRERLTELRAETNEPAVSFAHFAGKLPNHRPWST